jgi:uncharacterized protein (TIRG00374 family)
MSEQIVARNPPVEEDDDDLGEPRLDLTPRKLLGFGAFLIVSIIALYLLLPKLAGLDDTWHRLEDGSPFWLGLAFVLAIASFGGYVALFQGVFVRGGLSLNWRESYQVTMAGLAATRLFAAGGAGGLVLTAWALRQAGMSRREVADKTISFLVLTYIVYMAALMICGFGLHFGLFGGAAPLAFTLIPASIALVLTIIGFSLAFVPVDFAGRLEGFARRKGLIGRWAQKAANVPASVSAGVRDALHHIRDRDPALLGAVIFWAAQIAVLWAAFEAFGSSPPIAVLVMGFFVGMLGNLLPMPGGVGGVDGGMIGAFAAFGVDGSLALVAVLAYRGFVFWLPTIPGVIAYFQLRRTVERWKTRRRPAAVGGT